MYKAKFRRFRGFDLLIGDGFGSTFERLRLKKSPIRKNKMKIILQRYV